MGCPGKKPKVTPRRASGRLAQSGLPTMIAAVRAAVEMRRGQVVAIATRPVRQRSMSGQRASRKKPRRHRLKPAGADCLPKPMASGLQIVFFQFGPVARQRRFAVLQCSLRANP